MKVADNPPLTIWNTSSAIQSVLHSAVSKQQLTAAVTLPLGTTFAIPCPAFCSPPSCEVLVPSLRERQQRFQSQACVSRAMWACCDDTSSDDDEHNTDNMLLLLFADAFIAPALFAGLSEVDELKIALGCTGLPWTSCTVAQQDRPSPDPGPLPLDPGLEPWF